MRNTIDNNQEKPRKKIEDLKVVKLTQGEWEQLMRDYKNQDEWGEPIIPEGKSREEYFEELVNKAKEVMAKKGIKYNMGDVIVDVEGGGVYVIGTEEHDFGTILADETIIKEYGEEAVRMLKEYFSSREKEGYRPPENKPYINAEVIRIDDKTPIDLLVSKNNTEEGVRFAEETFQVILPTFSEAAQPIIFTSQEGGEEKYFIWNKNGKLQIEAHND